MRFEVTLLEERVMLDAAMVDTITEGLTEIVELENQETTEPESNPFIIPPAAEQDKRSEENKELCCPHESITDLKVNVENYTQASVTIGGKLITPLIDHDHDHDDEHDEHDDEIPFDIGDGTLYEYSLIGTPIAEVNGTIPVTYSYISGFLSSGLTGVIASEIQSAITEILDVFTAASPFVFTELADSGPPASDSGYTDPDISLYPMMRIGAHSIDGANGTLAHAYAPEPAAGLFSDVHFDTGETWNPAKFLEVGLHEVGHALGLGHSADNRAIMYPFFGAHFDGLGDAFLAPDDLNGIQSMYGYASNVAPVVDLPGSTVLYEAGSGDLIINSDAEVKDANSADFDTGSLTVSFTSGADANDTLNILSSGTGSGQIDTSGSNVRYEGTTIGTFTGGTDGTTPLVITFNGNADFLNVSSLMQNIRYRNDVAISTAGSRTVTFQVSDGEGGSDSEAHVVDIVGSSDFPNLTFSTSTVTYTPGSSPVVIDAGVDAAYNTTPSFNSGTITVSLTANGTTNDVLAIRDQGSSEGKIFLQSPNLIGRVNNGSGVLMGSYSGGTGGSDLVITLQSGISVEDVEAVMRNITYSNSSGSPDTTTRTLQMTLAEGVGGGDSSISSTISVNLSGGPANEAPTVASAIADVTVDEDDPDSVIDLSSVFDDTEDLNSTLSLSVVGNTNSSVVTTSLVGDQLTLGYPTNANGSSDITIRATDSSGATVEDTFTVTVNPVSDYPVLSNAINNFNVIEDSGDTVINLDSVFTDIDNVVSSLTYSIETNSNSEVVATNIAGSLLTLSYTGDAHGSAEITVRATNDGMLTTDDVFTVNVIADADTPTLSIEPLELTVEQPGDLIITSELLDTDGSETLKVMLYGLPTGANLNNGFSSGSGTWTLASDDLEDLTLKVPKGTQPFTLTVTATAIEGSNLDSATETGSIDINVLEPPTLISNGKLLIFKENKDPKFIDTSIKITDAGNKDFTGGSLEVGFVSGFVAEEDRLSFATRGKFVATETTITNNGFEIGNYSYDEQTGTLSIAFANDTTITDVGEMLRSITYENLSEDPTAQNRVLSIIVTDNDEVVSLPALRHIAVAPVNDAPVVTAPATLTTPEETSANFTLAITDVDLQEQELEVSLEAPKGMISLSQTTGLVFTRGDGEDDSLVIFTGSLDDINSAITGASYTPNKDFFGNDKILIGATDLGNSGSRTVITKEEINVTVDPVNDINLSIGDNYFSFPKDSSPRLLATKTKILDLLPDTMDGGTLTVDIIYGSSSNPLEDVFYLTESKFLSIDGSNVSYRDKVIGTFVSENSVLTVTFNSDATPKDVEEVVKRVTYRNDAEIPEEGTFTAQFVIVDGEGITSNAPVVSVSVDGVNDSPELTLPASPTIDEDNSVTFNASNNNLISFEDSDAGDNLINLKMETKNGALSFDEIDLTNLASSVYFQVGDGENDEEISVVGTLSDLNDLLDGMTFTPETDFNGSGAQIKFNISDLGHTGLGGVREIEQFLAINVTSQNDPFLTIKPNATVYKEGSDFTAIERSIKLTGVKGSSYAGHSITVDVGDGLPGLATSVSGDTLGVVSGRGLAAEGSSITFKGVEIATIDSTAPLTITFNENSKAANILTVLKAIGYKNVEETPNTINRYVSFLYADADGNESNLITKKIDFVPAAPGGDLEGAKTFTFKEGSTKGTKIADTKFFSSKNLATLDAYESLTLSFVNGNSTENDLLSIITNKNLKLNGNTLSLKGVDFATVSGGESGSDMEITFNENATKSSVGLLVKAISYSNDSEIPSEATRAVNFYLVGSKETEEMTTEEVILNKDSVIFVKEKNDKPTIEMETTPLTVDEDTPLEITGTTITDVDAQSYQIQITLSSRLGMLSLGDTTALTFLQGDGEEDRKMIFTGTVDDINNAIATITYQGLENRSGTDKLFFEVNDLSTGGLKALKDSIKRTITIEPVNDINLTTKGKVSTFIEDQDPVLFAKTAKLTDANHSTYNGGSLVVDFALNGSEDDSLIIANKQGITAADGNISFKGSAIGSYSGGIAGEALTINFSGSEDIPSSAIQKVISVLEYSNSSQDPYGFLGETNRVISMVLTDGDMHESNTSLTTIHIQPTNDLPEITSPDSVTIEEDSTATFSGNTLISLSDADTISGGLLFMTLKVDFGTLSLSGTSGLTFQKGDGSNDREVAFSGFISDINTALDGLVYTPNTNQDEADTLSIIAKDLNREKYSFDKSEKEIDIEITPINDPILSMSKNLTEYKEGGSVALPFTRVKIDDIRNSSLSGGTIVIDYLFDTATDDDILNIQEKFGFTLSNGTISLKGSQVATVSGGDAGTALTITFTSDVTGKNLEKLIGNITYSNSSVNPVIGGRTLEMVLTDGDGHVSNGLLSTIQVLGKKTPPELTAPTTATVATGSDYSLGMSIESFDSREGAVAMQVNIVSKHGRFTIDSSLENLIFVHGSGTSDLVLTFAGTAEEIATAVENLIYTPKDGYTGKDLIKIKIVDLEIDSTSGNKSVFHKIKVVVEDIPTMKEEPAFIEAIHNMEAAINQVYSLTSFPHQKGLSVGYNQDEISSFKTAKELLNQVNTSYYTLKDNEGRYSTYYLKSGLFVRSLFK